MTDPAPPSIPPRNRPVAPPPPPGRSVTSAAGRESGVQTAHSEDGAARETLETSASPVAASGGPTEGTGSELHDPPSPLMVAVDTTTGWIKKVAGATSAKISTANRPRTEDTPMTTTPTAPPGAGTSSPSTPSGAPAGPGPFGPSSSGAGSSAPAGSSARPSTGRIPTVAPHSGAPRRVRLAISRIDPWSVMKLAFLMSVAFGILIVVAVAVVWYTLNGMHVFTNINDLVTQITGTESPIDILQYVEFKRVISAATLVAVVDVFLLTALATIGAFLYNIVAALVGGLHVTMTDE